MTHVNIKTAGQLLKTGKIGVVKTDTLYGLMASVYFPNSIERIYRLKKRSPDKPCIIMINEINQLKEFSVELKSDEIEQLDSLWPGPVSVIFDINLPGKTYLHRGVSSLAFRWPKDPQVNELLTRSGPLVVPSANPEGMKPAQTIAEAEKYFGQNIDFYVDGGQTGLTPSKLIRFINGKIEYIRA